MGGNIEKHLALSSSFPCCINKIAPEPSLLQADSPSPLGLSLLKESSRSSITDMTLHLTFCSISLLCWEAQNLTLQMQPHQCWAESTSFTQLAAAVLRQPRRLSAAFAMAVHYWHIVAHQYTKLLLCTAVSQLVTPPVLLHPWCRILQFPVLHFRTPLSPKSPAWLNPSECKQNHVVYEQLLSVFCTICEFARGTLSQHSGH